MSPNTVTPELKFKMARTQGLLLRGSRWFINIKVPKDLRDAFGKEQIRSALGTSDYREASRKVVLEKARYAALFEIERKKLRRSTGTLPKESRRILTTLSRSEAWEFAAEYLSSKEVESRKWKRDEGRHLPSPVIQAIENDMAQDLAVFVHGDEDRSGPSSGAEELKSFLEERGIECAESSHAFELLCPLFYDAHVEQYQRAMDLVSGRPIVERDRAFAGISAYSPVAKEALGFTVRDLVSYKEKVNEELERSPKTKMAFQPAARLLLEVLGADTPLNRISREDMDRVFSVMKRIPLNVTQRYAGMSFEEAIDAAKKARDLRRPAQNTNWATYTQILAAFKLAVEDKMMADNPASSRRYREMFRKERGKARTQFSISDLNKLFRAPLYTGCENDGRGYAVSGSAKPRRGRFWVPLLALFHGMRNNEACQIYTEDVKCEGEIHFIAIREELDDEEESEKRLKTGQSTRNVPIHPELVRIGFLDFVENRRKDRKSPRLFPDLTSGHNGYFSDAFSKWFCRFVRSVLGNECKASLHSFRHQFRDATRAARLPDESVGRLAGWEHGKSASGLLMHQYGHGLDYLKTLSEDLAKVNYPGLNLAHLHRPTNG